MMERGRFFAKKKINQKERKISVRKGKDIKGSEKVMYKELVIIIIVIALIIIGNVVTQNNTIEAVNQISGELTLLRGEMEKESADQEKSKKQMKKVEEVWEEKYRMMAFYIEHNELEKVQTELTKLKADIQMEEYAQGVENLENCIFILEHIKDKSALKVVNIF